MTDWLVMSSIDLVRNNGRSFETNATDLDEAGAEAEASRRNAVEKAAGHKGIDWFPARDPMAMMADAMGMDLASMRASLGV